MKIYLCGVFKGTLTGQLQTILALKESLMSNFEVELIKAPIKNKFFIIDFFSYLISILTILLFPKKDKIFYLVLHRSRVSFWLRDFPIYFLNNYLDSKLICHLVGSDLLDFLNKSNRLENYFLRKYLRNIDLWVVLGSNMHSQVDKAYEMLNIKSDSKCYLSGKLKSRVIPGFVKKDMKYNFDYQKLDSKISKLNQKVSIGYMSNLIEEKGIAEFIEAMIILKENQGLEFEAWFAGATLGKLTKKVSRAIDLSSKKNYIENCGPVYGSKKWSKLAETHIFVLPTYYKTEALPLSILEAMKFGCVVVSTDAGEIEELLIASNGVFLKSTSPTEISTSISSLLKDKELLESKMREAYFFADQNFSFENFKNKVVDLIFELKAS